MISAPEGASPSSPAGGSAMRSTSARAGPSSGCAGPFHCGGSTDELRVYDRALSGSEVQQLQTATGATPPEHGQGGGGDGGSGGGGGGSGGGGSGLRPVAHAEVGRSATFKAVV